MLATIALAAALTLPGAAARVYTENATVFGADAGASLLLDFGSTRPERLDLPNLEACQREADRLVPRRAGGEGPSLPSLKGVHCVNRSAD